MVRARQPGSIIRLDDPSLVQDAFKASAQLAGVLVQVPMPDCVKAQLDAFPAAMAWQYRHSLGGPTETLPELHRMFGNVAAYMRDVEKIYESISALDVPARGSPLVYVGGRLSAPWHFDASKKPQALAKPGHLHMKGHAMRVMSVVGQYDLPLYDPKEDASQLIRFEDVAKMRTDPNVKTTEIEMRQGDLLIFTDECLHISGAVPGETELKLRESLGMFEIQMPQIATPPVLLQPAYLPHQSRTLA